ncbi:NRDE family protein [Novosphingobium sp.]|uniref:NRDE family protein n=1 Tax=Novosphingobium sp. TaxID=1874826 RepID=UPI002734B9B8|nr:NRDE family protein [Novosphingobium sp.]MDP3906811.1 NRDE family protein [Novosphingobium sp.]
MCVAAIAWTAHPRWRLVAMGNRDEYHARPTAPLARWAGGMIAGRDEQAGGTWLGVADNGRFALVTNFRVDGYPLPHLASRGSLVADWLTGQPLGDLAGMNPFNLFTASPDGAQFVTNHPVPQHAPLPPGIHGLSNGPFTQPWGKTRKLEAPLGEWLDADAPPEALFAALADRTPDPQNDPAGPAPDFSGVFIANPVYGTRCSTVVAVDHDGHGVIMERRFGQDGEATGETAVTFHWPA